MNALLPQPRFITEQDYLTMEAQRDRKHEYVDGDCYAMVGAGEKHNRITGNIFLHLRLASRGSQTGCGVFASDMKCRFEQGRFYTFRTSNFGIMPPLPMGEGWGEG